MFPLFYVVVVRAVAPAGSTWWKLLQVPDSVCTCHGFAYLLNMASPDIRPLHPAGKCCGVYRFHPARPTNHIIIAAIFGGCSVSSKVAIMPLLGAWLYWLHAGANIVIVWAVALLWIRPPCWLCQTLTHGHCLHKPKISPYFFCFVCNTSKYENQPAKSEIFDMHKNYVGSLVWIFLFYLFS